MLTLASGEAVTVITQETTRDADGVAHVTERREASDGWLIGPPTGTTATGDQQAVPDDCELEACVPKAYTAGLSQRVVERADGTRWAVIGDPQAYPSRLCPTPWDRVAYLQRVVS